MAQKMVKIHMRNRKVVEIPETNLNNFKRIFFSQIDYIEEEEGEPILSRPVIEEIKIEQPKELMTKKELQDLAKDLDGYKPTMSKKELIELINS